MSKFWKENQGLALFIFLMLIFRSAIADWNTVPTGSMKPTIVEGDRIWVNKMAYDLRIPFTHISLYKIADPERGDIVVFDSESLDKRLVKRVIGLPGEVIEMRNNVLIVNGVVLGYQSTILSEVKGEWIEDLLGIKHRVRIDGTPGNLSSFRPVLIPEKQYLVLGDNRNNSADSRVIGLIPRDEIVGRSRNVVLSLDYDDFYLPRKDRFFQSL